jgi:S-adenosylmethionine:tRNA ribosyltransferase-isomerase
LLAEIRSRGVQVCFVTLHVGLGTFAPVKAATIAGHFMHEERFDLSEESARIINDAKQSRRRVIAVGTTSVRVLESVASEARIPNVEENPQRQSEKPGSVAPPILYSAPGIRRPISQAALSPDSGKTRIFIYPPRNFEIVDAMLTNFHLPRSTLLMLVSAFAAPNSTRGREIVLSAYAEAIGERYRFFSYGDAMLVI